MKILTSIGLVFTQSKEKPSHLVLICHEKEQEETTTFIPQAHNTESSDDVWVIDTPILVNGALVQKAIVEAADNLFILIHGENAEVRTLGKPVTKIQDTTEMIGVKGDHKGIFYDLLNPLKFEVAD